MHRLWIVFLHLFSVTVNIQYSVRKANVQNMKFRKYLSFLYFLILALKEIIGKTSQTKAHNYLGEIVLDEITRVWMNIIRYVRRGLTNNSNILMFYISSNPKQVQILKALNSWRVELKHDYEHKELESTRDPHVAPPPLLNYQPFKTVYIYGIPENQLVNHR